LLLAIPLMALYTLLSLTGSAMAQAPDFFTAIPSNQLRDATPAQAEAIEKLRQRPTTQSLELVRVDINALRGDSVRLSIPNSRALTFAKRSEDVRGSNDFTWYGTPTELPGRDTGRA
jgi:hypothetical protein